MGLRGDALEGADLAVGGFGGVFQGVVVKRFCRSGILRRLCQLLLRRLAKGLLDEYLTKCDDRRFVRLLQIAESSGVVLVGFGKQLVRQGFLAGGGGLLLRHFSVSFLGLDRVFDLLQRFFAGLVNLPFRLIHRSRCGELGLEHIHFGFLGSGVFAGCGGSGFRQNGGLLLGGGFVADHLGERQCGVHLQLLGLGHLVGDDGRLLDHLIDLGIGHLELDPHARGVSRGGGGSVGCVGDTFLSRRVAGSGGCRCALRSSETGHGALCVGGCGAGLVDCCDDLPLRIHEALVLSR